MQSLLEWAKPKLLSRDKREFREGGAMVVMLEASPILSALEFKEITGENEQSLNEGTSTGDYTRGINQEYPERTGEDYYVEDKLRLIGCVSKCDEYLVEIRGGDEKRLKFAKNLRSTARNLERDFFKGNPVENVKKWKGLQYRLGDEESSQVLHNSTVSGGGALTLTNLDNLIHRVVNPSHILLSDLMATKLIQAARDPNVAGYVQYVNQEMGMPIMYYHGLPIIKIGVDGDLNPILPFTEENPGGGTPASTSIYCVSMSETGLYGFQNQGLRVEEDRPSGGSAMYTTKMKWWSHFTISEPTAVARLSGITDEPIA